MGILGARKQNYTYEINVKRYYSPCEMKCIEKAMNETECNPRRKWWGYVSKETGYRYLCRYNHTFAVFSSTEVLYSNYETVTDKRGVLFAINYFKNKCKK
ncbi:MAG: hypothetical protein WCI04_00370 [archaeon]